MSSLVFLNFHSQTLENHQHKSVIAVCTQLLVTKFGTSFMHCHRWVKYAAKSFFLFIVHCAGVLLIWLTNCLKRNRWCVYYAVIFRFAAKIIMIVVSKWQSSSFAETTDRCSSGNDGTILLQHLRLWSTQFWMWEQQFLKAKVPVIELLSYGPEIC